LDIVSLHQLTRPLLFLDRVVVVIYLMHANLTVQHTCISIILRCPRITTARHMTCRVRATNLRVPPLPVCLVTDLGFSTDSYGARNACFHYALLTITSQTFCLGGLQSARLYW
jgi:hypothetical protein